MYLSNSVAFAFSYYLFQLDLFPAFDCKLRMSQSFVFIDAVRDGKASTFEVLAGGCFTKFLPPLLPHEGGVVLLVVSGG